MSDNTLTALDPLAAQPDDVLGLPESELDGLIISATQVDGQWVILSRYSDDIWHLDGFTSNVPVSQRLLNFDTVPLEFRKVMKAMFYRYLRRGRRGAGRPKGSILQTRFCGARLFLRHLEALKLDHLGAATPMVCATYVAACKAHLQSRRSKGKPLSQSGLQGRFSAVETLYELSQYTDDPMRHHPGSRLPRRRWPDLPAAAPPTNKAVRLHLFPMMRSASCSSEPTSRLNAAIN